MRMGERRGEIVICECNESKEGREEVGEVGWHWLLLLLRGNGRFRE